MNEPKFPLGQIVTTPAVMEVITPNEMLAGLTRHVVGDWGDVCEEDHDENELSLMEGFRLLSIYRSKNGVKFWIITEADRSSTCILLPTDY